MPSGQAVPFSTTISGTTVHWVIADGCIPITYDPSLAIDTDALQKAVDGWGHVACSHLCLKGPSESSSPLDILRRERRIHIVPSDTVVAPQVAVSHIHFDAETGRALSASIDITSDSSSQSGLTEDDFLHVIGNSLGLGHPPSGVSSVLNEAAGAKSSYGAPTAQDVAALCVLYGDPAYCKE
jgi:hypothetical protein